jgi:DNA (cytosine-5)-methyltransferase 1
LTESLGEELLMSYLEDFHAKTLAQPVEALELTEKKVECGNTWRELLGKYNPDTALWKTAQCSLLEDLEQSLETWPRWGSMRNGECFRQPMLAQITLENEFGLSERIPNNINFFHTPCTTGIDGGSNSRKALKKRMGMWPTPTVGCVEGGEQSNRVERNLGGGYILRKLNKPNMTYGAKLSDAVLFEEKQKKIVNGGKLNPNWTEWLMGWPIGWTDLKPLETDKCHFVQQQLGDC